MNVIFETVHGRLVRVGANKIEWLPTDKDAKLPDNLINMMFGAAEEIERLQSALAQIIPKN